MRESVLLLQPPTVQHYRNRFAENNSLPPLGLLYLGTLLQQRGYQVRVIDFLVENASCEELTEILLEEQPGMVGVSVYAESFRFARVLARITKETLPDCLVAFGGAFPSFAYEEVLENEHVDYVVRFEGEETLLELIERSERGEKHPVRGVAGLAYRANGRVHAERPRPAIRDLDSLPIPNRDLVRREHYSWPFSISTSRGCPAKCTFCCAGAFWPGIRFRRVEKLIEELESLRRRYGMQGFYIADDTFTWKPRRVLEFCRLLEVGGHAYTWGCESRVDGVTAEMLKVMYASGCRRIQFGVESGVQAILDAVQKGTTLEQIDRACKWAREAGFFIIISFILGHPQDTLQTMRKTVAFVADLQRKYQVFVMTAVNTPFPGTYQYERAKELGLRIHSNNWDDFVLSHPIVSTKNFSVDDLRRIYTEVASSDIYEVNAELITGSFDRRMWMPG